MRTIARFLAILALAVGVVIGTSSLVVASSSNTNDAAYWETVYPNTQCYKHGETGSNEHGGVYGSNPTYVVLNQFNQAWFGDHWEALIVKGGSVDLGFGPGNAVYEMPIAGVHYFAPSNNGGNVASVSHWIVCKGETPATTTTTTAPPTTTTLPPTTTVPPTTVPPVTTTTTEAPTTVPEVTTTIPQTNPSVPVITEAPTTTVEAPTTTEAPTAVPVTNESVPAPTEAPTTAVAPIETPVPAVATVPLPLSPEVITTIVLPATGKTTAPTGAIALVLIGLGILAVSVARRRKTA